MDAYIILGFPISNQKYVYIRIRFNLQKLIYYTFHTWLC
jgi:hypothetical protein